MFVVLLLQVIVGILLWSRLRHISEATVMIEGGVNAARFEVERR